MDCYFDTSNNSLKLYSSYVKVISKGNSIPCQIINFVLHANFQVQTDDMYPKVFFDGIMTQNVALFVKGEQTIGIFSSTFY